MTNQPDTPIEILENMGEEYYPWHEYGDGYKEDNAKAIKEAKAALDTYYLSIALEAVQQTTHKAKQGNTTAEYINPDEIREALVSAFNP